MLSEHQNKNINFVHIMQMLKSLLQSGAINQEEYTRAKKYYQKVTGADLIVAE